MQRASNFLGRRVLATAATPTPAGNAAARSSLAAERRRLVRSVPAGARSGVASVFDAVAKNLRHNRTPLFGLNAQFRAYATESPQSGSTKPKQPQDAQEARDAKEQEQKKFEEEEKRLQEQKAKLMDEETVWKIADKDLPMWQYILIFASLFALVYYMWTIHRTGSWLGQAPLSDFTISALKWFPTREGSRLWGWLTNLEVPVGMRKYVYGLYSRVFRVNLDEAEMPMESYPSLAKFFTRNLKKGVRWVEPDCDMISPVDGRILHFGEMRPGGVIEQVKGIDYTLEQLIGADALAEIDDARRAAAHDPVLTAQRLADIKRASFPAEVEEEQPKATAGWADVFMHWLPFLHFGSSKSKTETPMVPPLFKTYYCVIYLAPGDYHGFHSPIDWKLTEARHFPGDLFSVSPFAARWIKGLFALNERVVLNGHWKHGFFSYIPVGAYNVGSITLDFDDEIRTNVGPKRYSYKATQYTGLEPKAGQRLGWFNLGSTIVMVFDAPEFVFRVTRGQKVKVGEIFGQILTPELKAQIEAENDFRIELASRKADIAQEQMKQAFKSKSKKAKEAQAQLEKEAEEAAMAVVAAK